MIHKNICNRRWQDKNKAKRKQKLALELYGDDWYKHFGQYRKGKIHCSCAMCQAKTNTKRFKSMGPVDTFMNAHGRGNRIPATNHRLGKKDYKHSEAKNIIAMNQAMLETLTLNA